MAKYPVMYLPPDRSSRQPFSGSPSCAFVIALLFVFVSVLCQLRSVDDADLFLQLRLGLDFLAHGKTATENTLSYTLGNLKVSNPGWLSQLTFAIIDRYFGLPALRFFHSLLFAAGLSLAACTAVIGLSPAHCRPACRVILLSGLAGFLVASTNTSLRPQSYAVFCFGALMALLARKQAGPVTLFTAFFIGVLWSNTHPSLAFGLLYCACFLVAPGANRQRRAISRSTLKILGVLACSSLVSPDPPVYSGTAAANFQISRLVLGISEWMPAWHSSVRDALIFFWLSVPLTFVLFFWRRRELSFSDCAVAVLFLSFSLYSARFSLFYALAMIPIWGSLVKKSSHDLPFSPPRHVLLFALAAVSLSSIPLFLNPCPVVSQDIPVAAVEALKKKLPSGRIYNYREHAGPLVYFGNREWQIKIDGRLYLYPESLWRTYYREASGLVPIEEIEGAEYPTAFFLHPGFDSGLLARLEESQNYVRTYSDSNAVVYISKPRAGS